MSQSKIEITNPTPGGQRHTSLRRATELVIGGQAAFKGNQLLLIGPAIEWRERLAAAECEREFKRNHGERVYWNGARGSDKMFPPGCNVAFKRPWSG